MSFWRAAAFILSFRIVVIWFPPEDFESSDTADYHVFYVP